MKKNMFLLSAAIVTLNFFDNVNAAKSAKIKAPSGNNNT